MVFDFIFAGDPEEPATLISTLLLQTHARLLYCLAQIFASFWWTSSKNVWNAENVIGSLESHAQQQRRPLQMVVSCSLVMSRFNHFVLHEMGELYHGYKPRSKH